MEFLQFMWGDVRSAISLNTYWKISLLSHACAGVVDGGWYEAKTELFGKCEKKKKLDLAVDYNDGNNFVTTGDDVDGGVEAHESLDIVGGVTLTYDGVTLTYDGVIETHTGMDSVLETIDSTSTFNTHCRFTTAAAYKNKANINTLQNRVLLLWSSCKRLPHMRLIMYIYLVTKYSKSLFIAFQSSFSFLFLAGKHDHYFLEINDQLGNKIQLPEEERQVWIKKEK